MSNTRKIIKIRYGLKAGAMTAFINRDNIAEIDPFVLWDHFETKEATRPVGLDYHGHSGVDTVSYPVAGNLKHIDSSDCQATLQGGDIHVMTTGGGIIHKDTITPQNGNAETFQLWTALPADKGEMDDASSASYTTSRLPLIEETDSTTKVLIGSYNGVQSPVHYSIEMTYLDIIIAPYGVWHYQPDKNQTSGFIYLRSGIAYINGNQIHPCQMGILETSAQPIQIKTGNTGTRLFVVLGEPLNQPLISSGASVHSSKKNLVLGKNKIEELMNTVKTCR